MNDVVELKLVGEYHQYKLGSIIAENIHTLETVEKPRSLKTTTLAVLVRKAWVTMYLVKQSVITNKNTFACFDQGKEPISLMEIIFHGRWVWFC
jgi:hypothetical protein